MKALFYCYLYPVFGKTQHLRSIKGHCHMINNTLRLQKGKLLQFKNQRKNL